MNDADNPYLPPKAFVADVSNQPPMVRPTAVTVAVVVLLFGPGRAWFRRRR